MGLRISTNLAALSSARALAKVNSAQQKVYQRLASGQRITEAGDDAAGLSISETLRARIRSTAQAERNANDSLSFAQVAEGGLNEIGNMVIRMRELAVQAASDTVGDRERGFIQTEVLSLMSEIDRIANGTKFGGYTLLNGEGDKTLLEFQVGAGHDESDRILFNIAENDVRASSLGIEDLDYSSTESALDAMDKVDSALGKVFETRSRLGAMQNKLHATINNLAIMKENLLEARSRIADTDLASETGEVVRGNILQSAGIAVLAQANSSNAQALKLLM